MGILLSRVANRRRPRHMIPEVKAGILDVENEIPDLIYWNH
jgi:hypothetical protein